MIYGSCRFSVFLLFGATHRVCWYKYIYRDIYSSCFRTPSRGFDSNYTRYFFFLSFFVCLRNSKGKYTFDTLVKFERFRRIEQAKAIILYENPSAIYNKEGFGRVFMVFSPFSRNVIFARIQMLKRGVR